MFLSHSLVVSMTFGQVQTRWMVSLIRICHANFVYSSAVRDIRGHAENFTVLQKNVMEMYIFLLFLYEW